MDQNPEQIEPNPTKIKPNPSQIQAKSNPNQIKSESKSNQNPAESKSKSNPGRNPGRNPNGILGNPNRIRNPRIHRNPRNPREIHRASLRSSLRSAPLQEEPQWRSLSELPPGPVGPLSQRSSAGRPRNCEGSPRNEGTRIYSS